MNLNKLTIFKTLYECGNTSRASETLNVTRSAISQNLSQLERQLGVTLFIRSPKGLIPTSTAHELAVNISTHLDEISHHVNALATSSSGHAGILNIGAPPAIGTIHMPEIIEAFSQKHPNVEIRLTLAYSNELSQKVLSGHLDISLIDVFGGVNLKNDFFSICNCEPLADEKIVMVCSPEYLKSHLTKGLSYIELCKQDFLSIRQDTLEIKSWFHHQFGETPPYIRKKMISENGLGVLDCACRGLGLCVFGSKVTQAYVKKGQLTEIRIKDRGEKNQISLIQLLDRKPRKIEKDFVTLVKQYAKKQWKSGM